MKEIRQRCLECGKRLLGRIDKKFCDDSCRSTYNNAKNSIKSVLIQRVKSQLRQNYRILGQYNTSKKTTVARQTLALEGVNFELFTSTYTNKSNNTYYF